MKVIYGSTLEASEHYNKTRPDRHRDHAIAFVNSRPGDSISIVDYQTHKNPNPTPDEIVDIFKSNHKKEIDRNTHTVLSGGGWGAAGHIQALANTTRSYNVSLMLFCAADLYQLPELIAKFHGLNKIAELEYGMIDKIEQKTAQGGIFEINARHLTENKRIVPYNEQLAERLKRHHFGRVDIIAMRDQYGSYENSERLYDVLKGHAESHEFHALKGDCINAQIATIEKGFIEAIEHDDRMNAPRPKQPKSSTLGWLFESMINPG